MKKPCTKKEEEDSSLEEGEICETLKLFPHQEVGVQAILDGWFLRRYHDTKYGNTLCHAFLLFDEMGLGKTIQAWEALRRLQQDYNCGGPYLIVCPSSCIAVWDGDDYIKYFARHFEVRQFIGRKGAVVKTLQNMSCRTVVVTSYDTLRSAFNLYIALNVQAGTIDTPALLKFCTMYARNTGWGSFLSGDVLRRKLLDEAQKIFKKQKFAVPAFAKTDKKRKDGYLLLMKTTWTALIMDEVQKIKKSSSKSAKAVGFVNAQKRLALTGTPIMNHGKDLITITKYGLNLFYADWNRFHCNPQQYKIFREAISLGRKRADVPELQADNERDPEKERVIIPWHDEIAKRIYVREKSVTLQILEAGKVMPVQNALARLQRLRQICLHPDLPMYYMDNMFKTRRSVEIIAELAPIYRTLLLVVLRRYPAVYSIGDLRKWLTLWTTKAHCNGLTPSAKMWASLRVIQENRTRKVVLFSTYKVFFQKLMAPWLRKLGIGCLIYCGNSREKQLQIEEAFETRDDVRVLLLVKSAGGLGLNLQKSASVICQLDPHYNEALDEQAVHRIYRIGQQKQVIIRKFYMEGSIDEAMHLMQQRKNNQIDAWLGNTDGRLSMDVVRLYLKKYDTVK